MRRAIALSLFLAAAPAAAQHVSYAGQQQREIKALSAEELAQYLAGAGMGHAKAAELNRFPGPQHVLELADRLRLSAEQRASMQRLLHQHKAEARAIGARLVAAERELDALFRSAPVDETELAGAVRRTAALHGEYRLAHLETHRRTRALLTAEQVDGYDVLRGYAAPAPRLQHRH